MFHTQILPVLVSLMVLWHMPLHAQDNQYVQQPLPLHGDLAALPSNRDERFERLWNYGLASLEQAIAVLKQHGGVREMEVQFRIPSISDTYRFADNVVAYATYLRYDDKLYFLCTSRGPDASVAKAEALCQRLAAAYNGSDF